MIEENRFPLSRSVLAMALVTAILALAPVAGTGSYQLHELILILMGIVLAMGLRLMIITGRLSIGHGAFMAIGAYTTAVLSVKAGVNPWLGMVAGSVLATLISVGLGYMVMRVGGMYFAFVTLCFAQVTLDLISWAEPLTGGQAGLIRIPAPEIPAFHFGINKVPYYYTMLVVTIVAVVVLYRMEHSRIGMAFRSIGENEVLAQHLGINLARYRILAFAVASFFAGLTGAFFAHYMHYVTPSDFGFMQSLYIQIYVVIGGMGTIVGSIVGATFMIGVSNALAFSLQAQPIFFGAALVLTMLVLPEGLVSLPQVVWEGIQSLKRQDGSRKAAVEAVNGVSRLLGRDID